MNQLFSFLKLILNIGIKLLEPNLLWMLNKSGNLFETKSIVKNSHERSNLSKMNPEQLSKMFSTFTPFEYLR